MSSPSRRGPDSAQVRVLPYRVFAAIVTGGNALNSVLLARRHPIELPTAGETLAPTTG